MDIDNFFNNDVIISSLVTNLNSLTVIGSTVQKIVNWVTTADGCVHSADATQLVASVSAVCTGLKRSVIGLGKRNAHSARSNPQCAAMC